MQRQFTTSKLKELLDSVDPVHMLEVTSMTGQLAAKRYNLTSVLGLDSYTRVHASVIINVSARWPLAVLGRLNDAKTCDHRVYE